MKKLMNTYIKIRVSVQSNVIFVFNVILKNEPSRLDGLFASASRPSGSGRRAGPGRENNYISEHARDCCLDQGELSSPVEATVSCVFTPIKVCVFTIVVIILPLPGPALLP